MLVNTPAIVLSKTNYGDSSLILRCYTLSSGIKSYIIKGARSKGKKQLGLYQPLSQIEISARHKNKGGLEQMQSAKINIPYQSIPYEMDKLSVIFFLSEILEKSLREEEANPNLYSFIENSLYWFDTHDKAGNFHISFLLQLTKHLGFYPDMSTIERDFFDVENGQFVADINHQTVAEKNINKLLKQFLGTKFDSIQSISITGQQKKQLLSILMNYYKIHVYGFSSPKSLNVLYEIYS
jgi:DNA repair protein RecO (recombination protein O)